MQLDIAGHKLPGPILIPSVSSFETQCSVLDAIALQGVFNEPVTLVSAFDVNGVPELDERVRKFRERGGIVFLDSGGYESSRIKKYVAAEEVSWTIDDYIGVRDACEFDLCASYDDFIEADEKIEGFISRFLSRTEQQATIGVEKLVPVIHLKDYNGSRVLHFDETLKLIDSVVSNFEPAFIAIPERELGGGLVQKHKLAQSIVERLNGRKRRTHLHILGCGNPLSFMILADAGIAMADGLEWCRTLIGPNYHLHHFQQGEQFPEPDTNVYNFAADVIRGSGVNYQTATLGRNLNALQGLAKKVADAVDQGTLPDLIRTNFGDQASRILE